ncbi:Alpha/beta hydrolase family protein [Actinoalloteichus hymeniacidonis]|uniref:Alpha/beta hydrolase family protein n=2 Tax=Actinoalloteichus hymeniacidonis TaxID=340345 RepID=A0AAC9HKP3_9PSEU|nr:Alpha/beta hydrolase family protein [Actinoalloteichus hymeniacidonis]
MVRRFHAMLASTALLGIGVVGTTVLPTGTAMAESRSPVNDPITLTLPAPTGPAQVGTVELHLIDSSRPDPWVPSAGDRELMVSIWYPTDAPDPEAVRAPWIPPNAGEALIADFAEGSGLPVENLRLPETAGVLGAPAVSPPTGHPVVLYSPGSGLSRSMGTSLVQDLASHGYVVVTVDHTYNAGQVEFPDGRVVLSTELGDDFGHQAEVHADDLGFVVDALTEIAEGGNPDAADRELPEGLGRALNLAELGILGHSLGGSAAAVALQQDPRFDAAVSLDGPFFGSVIEEGFDEPFLLFRQSTYEVPTWNDSWDAGWPQLRGDTWQLGLAEGSHNSFSDFQTFYPQLVDILELPSDSFTLEVGTIEPAASFAAQQRYSRALFDQELRGIEQPLLTGPSPEYPQVEFLR